MLGNPLPTSALRHACLRLVLGARVGGSGDPRARHVGWITVEPVLQQDEEERDYQDQHSEQEYADDGSDRDRDEQSDGTRHVWSGHQHAAGSVNNGPCNQDYQS